MNWRTSTLATGECVADSIANGAINGAMNGFIAGAIMGAGKAIAVKKAVKAANAAPPKPTALNESSGDFLALLNKDEANNVVYKGISKSGNEVYTGITKQKINVRLTQHNNIKSKYFKGFKNLEVKAEALTRNQARAIETFKILNDGTSTLNKSLSISKSHRFFDQAIYF